jgi:mono/diheme cytochrome c family protein
MSTRKSLFRLRSLPPAVAAVAAVGMSGSALAQNAANGATLYKTAVPIPNSAPLSCENCHGPANIFKAARFPNTTEAGILVLLNGAIQTNKGLMGAFSGWSATQRADVAAYVAGATSAPPPPPLVQPPAPSPTPTPAPGPAPAPTPAPPSTTPTTSPDVARFASVEVGKESATSGVLVTNSTTAAVKFSTPALTPPAGKISEFVATTAPQGSTNCVPGYRLEPGTSCSFGVRFAPLASGVRTETWSIKFDDNVPARDLTLEGTAIANAASESTSEEDGGGGALGLGALFGLAGLAAVARLRRRLGN